MSSRNPQRRAATVTGRVVDAVIELLREGRLQVGDQLPSEWALVEQLSVGRSAVREAMRELATLEVVEIRRGRGTFVRSLRPDLLLRPERLHSTLEEAAKREFLEVRRILEPEAAALAATRASAEEIGRLERDIELLREGVAAGYRPPEDLGFHLDVVRATHNTALTRLAGVIVSYYERDRMAPAQRDVAEHGDVLRAIARRDPDGARRAMLRHLAGEEQARPYDA